MTIKDTVGGHEDAAIIREAERGERIALERTRTHSMAMLPPGAR